MWRVRQRQGHGDIAPGLGQDVLATVHGDFGWLETQVKVTWQRDQSPTRPRARWVWGSLTGPLQARLRTRLGNRGLWASRRQRAHFGGHSTDREGETQGYTGASHLSQLTVPESSTVGRTAKGVVAGWPWIHRLYLPIVLAAFPKRSPECVMKGGGLPVLGACCPGWGGPEGTCHLKACGFLPSLGNSAS